MKNISRSFSAFVLGILALIAPVTVMSQVLSGNAPQRGADGGWVVRNPYSQKAFIVNRGQYDWKDRQDVMPLYGFNDAGAQMYFNRLGHTFRFDSVLVTGQESYGPGKAENADGKTMRFLEYYVRMNWIGANPNVSVVADEVTTDYHCFSNPFDEKKSIDFVPAYKKLTYKNLYPNIDVEYTFHKEKGIKYQLVLRPGADITKVKMQYTGAKNMHLDFGGNIHINTEMGEIVDHAPYNTFYKHNGKAVPCSFVLDGNTVSFKLGNYDNTKELVIDPWTVNPNFPQNNKAYDIMKDGNGNIYVFGGKNPYLLKKYDLNGNLLWTYTSAMTGWYGDLAVHPSGDSYITEGYSASNAFGRIAKVNNAGVQQWQQQYNQLEFWGLAFNCNYTVLTVAGGVWQGKTSTVNLNTGALTSTITFCNNGETRGMTQAPTGNFYHLCISGANAIYALNSASAVVWNTPSGFTNGYGTPSYNNSYNSMDAGFNGIGCSNNFVYSINGTTLNQKNITTGATVTTQPIPGGTLTGNGGVFVDACGSVYVGSQTQIHKFSSGMALQSSTASPGAVYCLANGVAAGDVLACGNTFIASINIAGICPFNLTINITTTGGCGGGSGTATASVSGGSGAYTYNWNNGATTSGISNLTAGTYTVNVTDALSCVPFSQTVTIGSGSGPNATISNSSNATCSQGGTATVSGSAGTAPYTYLWSSSGQTTQTATGLTTGTYTVTVTDNGGCSKTVTVGITGTSGPSPSVTNINNATCSTTGSATASGTGGTGSYTYSWSNAQTTQTATGLTAGVYTVTITDANNCSQSTTVNITGSAGPNASVTNINNATCATTGTATASGTGGTGSYTYLWSNSQTTQTATGLTAGTYTVTITDANNCSKTATVSITGAPGPTASISNFTNATCASAGNATASAVNGNGTYTYLWSGSGQTTQTATGLTAGTYTVTVTDGNGCTSTSAVTITGAAGPTVTGTTPTNVLCNGGSNGSATATATGGTGTLTYVWSNGQSAANATGLTAGTYTVVVSDGNGCTSTSQVTITEPPVLVAQALGTVTCAGQAGTASVTGNGGNGGYGYLWNNGQATQTATGLTTGTYTVTITDANNCTAVATAQVNANSNPSALFTGVDTVGCAPLCVTFSNTTANITTWAWDFGDGSTGTGASPKHCYTNPGTYSVTLTVTDNNGCTGTYAKNAWIQVYPQVTAAFVAGPQPTTVMNPVIQFTDKSFNATSWNWSFGDLLNSTSTLQNPKFNYKDSGCYTVRLIADNTYGCADTSDQVVCIMGDYTLYAPNAFTPDGSGVNDIWNVKGVGIDPNHFKLMIFDRWGDLIYETSDLYKGWDGRANGGKDIAQQDVYVWKVAAQDFLGGKHTYIGHVTLVR